MNNSLPAKMFAFCFRGIYYAALYLIRLKKKHTQKKHLAGHYSTMLKLKLREMDACSLQLTLRQAENTTNKAFRLPNDIFAVSTNQRVY